LPIVPEPTAAGFGANGFAGKFQMKRADFAVRGLPVFPGQYEGSWGVSGLLPDQFHLMSPPTMEILNSSFAEVGDGQRTNSGVHDLVLISPEDALRLGVTDGSELELFNEHGAIRRNARVTPAVQKQLLVVEGVFWPKHLAGRGGVNELTSERTAALSGIPSYHEVVVRVRR
jgi:anaerobic selenocysteine-containing dehydrogenase